MSTVINDLKWQFRSGGIVIKLILINVALFLVPEIVFTLLKIAGYDIDYVALFNVSSDPGMLLFKPWSLLTYAFFHAGFFHLLFNMLVLNFTGRLFLTYFKETQLLSIYLSAAIVAALVFITAYNLIPFLKYQIVPMVGASGAIMAILLATATYNPLMEVRLLLIGTVKLWHIALVLIALDIIQLFSSNTGGHFAHLAGALAGYVYMKNLQSGGRWFAISDRFAAFCLGIRQPKKNSKMRTVHKQVPKKAVINNDKSLQQKRVDEILDKISKSGYDSLSAEEKEFLFRVGQNQ